MIIVLSKVRGMHEDSFKLLLSYNVMLKNNSVTHTSLEVEIANNCKYLWQLEAI